MKHYHHNPDITVEFVTFKGERFTITPHSYHSTRTMQEPTSRAVITFKGLKWIKPSIPKLEGREIDRTLSLHDLCRIKLRDGEGNFHTDLVGLIHSVQTVETQSDGYPMTGTSIHVYGLGDAMNRSKFLWHPHIVGRSNLGNNDFLKRLGGHIPKGRVDQVLASFYNAFVNDEFAFTLADGRRLSMALQPQFSVIKDGMAQLSLASLGGRETLWKMLAKYADMPWNELFLIPQEDAFHVGRASGLPPTNRGEVSLVLRPTPFDLETWRTLRFEDGWGYTIKDSERKAPGFTLARNADDVYNFFWTPALSVHSAFRQQAVLFSQSGGKLPIYNTDLFRRFGVHKLERQTLYCQYMEKGHEVAGSIPPAKRLDMQSKSTAYWQLLQKRSLQLALWFGFPEFRKGVYVTRGRVGASREHGARIGSIVTRENGMEGYVTGIEQDWTFPGPHSTTWHVTRVHYPDEYGQWVNKFKQSFKLGKTDASGASVDFV